MSMVYHSINILNLPFSTQKVKRLSQKDIYTYQQVMNKLSTYWNIEILIKNDWKMMLQPLWNLSRIDEILSFLCSKVKENNWILMIIASFGVERKSKKYCHFED